MVCEKVKRITSILQIFAKKSWKKCYVTFTLGKVENLDELADDLFEAADKYDLAELKTMCENALCNNLSVDGAAKTLALADLHHANELKSITMDYIITNAGEVMLTEGWKTVARPSHRMSYSRKFA
ncbi:hypothetical protein U1Q18_046964 [Sarracenia purpurea var. burkii]